VNTVSEDERADIPAAVIDDEFARGEQMLADATKAHAVDISKATIVNRLYYACFHAAQAALHARGFDPQLHGRVQTLFGQKLIQDGDVSREFGRFLNDMETYRCRVDYRSGGVERDTADLLERTEGFLDAMRDTLDEEKASD
jgi:uncharacterized protein (UPF0332 family)